MTALPPFIMTSQKGSFARKTIEERKPLIVDKILADYDYTPGIRKALMNFKEVMITGTLTPLRENTTDREIWNDAIKPWLGNSWLKMPWFLAESYFYRRVLEIVQYFQPGPWKGRDPYANLKTQEMVEALPLFFKKYTPPPNKANLKTFKDACYNALWGNRGDLSNLEVFEDNMESQSNRIILNHVESAYQFLKHQPVKIAYFFDNVGKELFFDLALIDYLLKTGLAQSITCYLKNQPFFVSDAMRKDLKKSIHFLASSQFLKVQNLTTRLNDALNANRMTLADPPFFTTSGMYRNMGTALKNQIGKHDLTILKGDVNYRRLFGDRHWEPTTTVKRAGGYFPTSFLSLRTLKAELIIGVSQEIINQMNKEAEHDWQINGKRGMITFHQK